MPSTGAARQYHEATRLAPGDPPLTVDWGDQPRPYKLYRDLEPVPLPRQLQAAPLPALAALAGSSPPAPAPLDLAALATILHHSAGVTRRLRLRQGTMLFRAASCTGALYHIELYVVCGPLPDLEAGVYHFGVHDFALRRLRAGDFRGVLVDATGAEPHVATAAAMIISTSTFWRNAWRYGERSYRHAYWDDGTILANLLGMASAHSLRAHVVTGFVDRDVNRLLGLDSEREAALTLVTLGSDRGAPPPPAPAVPPIDPPTVPISAHDIVYPEMRALHAASSLGTLAAAATWRGAPPLPDALPRAADIPPAELSARCADPLETVIARRGSARRFTDAPVGRDALDLMLALATRPLPLDAPGPQGAQVNDVYLIAAAVDGLEHGAYVMRPEGSALELLRRGDGRAAAGDLAVSRTLAHSAAVSVYFLTDLDRITTRYGDRGYRVAQLEAGIMGGRLYLAAYALGLAASGLTFYDDAVTAFFSPHAAGKSAMFLVVLGKA